MLARRIHRVAMLAVMLTLPLAQGCAKKAMQAPPEPPPAPPTTETRPPAGETPRETPPTPRGEVPGASSFQPVFFEFDSYSLREDGRTALDANARLLREHGDMRMVIEGHCDERGTAEYNQALGERRAQAARDYLTQAGIAADRLRLVTYGKERPFDPGHDEGAWAKNRRAHFAIP